MPIHLVFVLALFNTTSMRAARVVITLYAIKLGAGPFAVGMLAAAFGLLPTALSWFVGRLSDQYGARWLLIVGAASASVGMLLPFVAPSLAMLYIAAVLNGLSFAFYNVSLQHVVGIVSGREHRTRNFSNYSLVQSVTSFLGPLVAGFAIDHSGYEAACLYLVVLSAIPVGMLMIWGRILPRGAPHATSKVSLKETLGQPGVWRVLAASSLAQSGNDLFQFYMPVYGRAIGLSASSIGSILAAFAAAAFVIRAAMSRLLARYGDEKVLAAAFFAGAASILLIPLFTHALVLGAISFVFGLGMGCIAPITMILAFSRSSEGRSGETLGLRLTADNLTRLVAPVMFGAVASSVGLLAIFWLNAAMLGAGGAFSRGKRIANTERLPGREGH